MVPRYDPDERFKLDAKPEDVIRKLLDDDAPKDAEKDDDSEDEPDA